MIVSYRHDFVFASNPKAASTSIETALVAFQERADLDAIECPGYYTARHMPAVEIRERIGPSQWDRMFTFGVVRHPCDWLVSQLTYNYRRLGLPVPHGRRLTDRDVRHVHAILTDRRGQPASASGSQWAFLCSEARAPVVSAVVTLESLDEGWSGLLDRVDAAIPPLERLNRTGHPDWTDWLDSSARRAVEALWEDDFDLYRQAGTSKMVDGRSA
ncbi:hypothetical protein [Streptomyces canus]|uniref:hypothetical protein n=1 Tax=Streptomyces canus TaxID=58343 RepID=UPI0003789942|nr:hypothetical protein [Streptomyces canus]